MKKALIVVDMQNAFFENEVLAGQREHLVEKCNLLIRDAHAYECPVILLRTIHMRTKETWTLNMLEDDQGFLFEDDLDSKYVIGLQTKGAVEITKTRDSGFWQTDLLSHLRHMNVKYIVICGVSTHTCVAETASDAYAANLRVELITDAIATHDPDYHDGALQLLHEEYRMPLLTTYQIVWLE